MKLRRNAFVLIAVAGLLLGCSPVQPAAADRTAPDGGTERLHGVSSAPLASDGAHGLVVATETEENSTHDGDGGHDEATSTDTESHGDEHSASHEATETATNASGGHGADGDHQESGQHDESSRHGGAGLTHLAVEGLQIVFGFAAVASVVLAGRVYGGEVGRALIVSGVGVTLFAAQRLWHNLHELGLLESLPAFGQQGLFILAAGALAAGYLSLYRTMTKRTG